MQNIHDKIYDLGTSKAYKIYTYFT